MHRARGSISRTSRRLNDLAPGDVLMTLLSKEPTARLAARVPVAARKPTSDEPLTPEQHAAIDAYTDQQYVRTKLRMIAEEARTYEQDTGVCALNLGFPLLSLPPGTFGGRFGVAPSRRVLAPLAFIPLTVIVKTSSQLAVEMSRREGADTIIPNQALLAWLEKETGKPLGEILTGDNPQGAWGEIVQLVREIANLVELAIPDELAEERAVNVSALATVPKGDDENGPSILPAAAVLGLYPASNQGLLRDMREMIAGMGCE